jgi:hypothetical protein
MPRTNERHLATVDLTRLHQFHWPVYVLRLVAPGVLRRLELRRYLDRLLADGRWDRVRAVPKQMADGTISKQVYDIYAHPKRSPAAPWRDRLLGRAVGR